MKKSVRKVVAAAIVLCLAFALAACSGKSKYVGTWKLTSAEAAGMTISDPASMGLDISLELKQDGTAVATVNGTTSENGKWEEKDGGIEVSGAQGIVGSSEEVLKFKMEDNKLVAEQESGGMTVKMVFEKQQGNQTTQAATQAETEQTTEETQAETEETTTATTAN